MKKGELSKTVIIDARPSEVFRALSDEKELPNWFPNAGAQLERRVGGKVVLKTRMPGSAEVHTISGRIVEFVPDRKLSHTWSNEQGNPGGESIVTWTLEELEGGKTRVTLVHTGISDDKYDITDKGWSYFTSRLADYCRQNPTADIVKTIVIDAPRAAVFKAITDPEELVKWFPDQAVLEPRKGGLVQFRFFDNGQENHRSEGKVIEIVPDEKLVYSWKNTSDPDFPDTTVSWTLESVGSRTRVTLVHSGFDPKGKWRGLHDQGWGYFVNRLDRLLHGEPLDDKQVSRERGDLPKPC